MTHGGAATLCSPVLLYNFVASKKERECGMNVRDCPNAIREHRGHQKHHILLQAKRNKGTEKAAMNKLFGIGGLYVYGQR